MDGIARERAVTDYFVRRAYLVASRRHLAGPGDLVAIPSSILQGNGDPAYLVEVKATRRAFERFGPVDRLELLEVAREHGLEPLLAHWPANGGLELIGPDGWPATIAEEAS